MSVVTHPWSIIYSMAHKSPFIKINFVMMSNQRQHTNNTVPDECGSKYFSEDILASIKELSQRKQFKKGDIIIREGQFVDTCYHVVEGCLRQYRIVDGEERSIFFFTEDQSILSLTQNNSIYLSNHYVDCIEDTTVTVMTSDNEKELYRRHPEVESMSRISLESMIKNHQEMFSDFIVSTPEERYLNLLETRPDLLGRVPQYHLASYLGVKPESLSRIRKRLAEKKNLSI